MTKKVIEKVIEKELKDVTKKVRVLLGYSTRTDLKEKLSITMNTLRSRLLNHKWTYEEVLIINALYAKIG